MTDLANLVLAVDSTQVKTGTASLDGLTAAGARAEAATIGLGKGARTASTEAAALAASAQAAARAAVGQAAGFGAVTSAVHGNTVAMRETLVVSRELLNGNLTRLPGSLSILAQQFAISGKGASGFAAQILQSFGIIKKVTDADIAGEAAAAAGAANALRAVAARAEANVTAADTEVALAQASIKTAATTEALTAAQAELVAAHEAVAAAAVQATVAEVALADAAAAEATAAAAAAAATTTALAPIGAVLAGVAVVAGTAYAAFKLFQGEVAKSGELQDYANSLGLTTKEMKKLTDVSVTFGDVMKGVWKTVSDHTGADSELGKFKAFAIDQFKGVLRAGVGVFAELYGSIVGTYRAVIIIWQNLPAAFADIFIQAVNQGIGALNKLVETGTSLLNGFIDQANKLPFVNIAHAAVAPISAIGNAYAGAAKSVAGALKGEIDKATSEAKASANALIAETERNITQASKNRIKTQADELAGDQKGAAAKHAHAAAAKKLKDATDDLTRAAQDALKSGESYLTSLNRETDAIGKNAVETKRMEVATEAAALRKAAAVAPTDALRNALLAEADAIAQAGATWERLTLQEDARKKAAEAAAAAEKAQQEAFIQGLQDMQSSAQQTASIISDAFGSVGKAFGKLITAQADYKAVSMKIAADVAAGRKAEASDLAAQRRAEVEGTYAALGALKSLFKEHSAGYKAMEAAEKAYAIVQAISTIKSVAAGAAKMFAQLGVWAFPAVAAMIAVMAGLGFSGGSSSQTAPTSAEDLQKAAGAGTVLGDPTAKSASIADSLELMAKNSTKALDYSDGMLRQLRSIASSIGALTAAVARSLNLSGGFFDTTGKLGTSSSGIQGLFGSTKTTSLYDQGFILNPATVEQIMEQGITGATYQVLQTVKKNSGFLGIGGSTKTSYSTSTGALDSDITSQINAIIGQLYTSVVSAAKVLGLDVGEALKQFQVEIGKISFKDLTGQQITDELNAIFSKIGDQMAGFAVAGLAQFQKAGEGLFETLMRLAKDYLTIDAALKSIGMTFGSVGASSIAARESLIDLAGGLDAFVSQVNFFYDHFLSNAQKVAMEQAQVNASFAALGVAVPASIADFAKLVTGLDLSTDAGQQMFEALMQIAPAFYDVATAADQLAQKQQELQVQLLQAQGNTAGATALQRQIALAALDPSLQDLQKQIWAAQDASAAAAAALDLNNKAQQLQIALLQAQGDATGALALQRKLELAALDPTLRSLQEQVYAAQDAAAAKDNLVAAYKRESTALKDTADKFHKFADDLKAFRDSLFTAAGGGPASYNSALVQLMKQAGLATAGDEGALGGGLQNAAQSFLDIATQNASSSQDVARARALVARYLDQAIGSANSTASIAQQQLDKMTAQVSKLVDINDSVLSVTDAIKALTALMFPPSAPATTPTPSSPGFPSSAPSSFPFPVSRGGPFGSGIDSTLTQQILDRLDDIHAATAQTAVSANNTARVFRNAERSGAIAIVTDADSPIATVAG